MKRISLAIVLGLTLAGVGTIALASRNSSGTYTLPSGNPVTGGTITKAWANSTLGDLATETTNSLDRYGRGGMLAPMRGTDGTVSAPAFSFTNESGTGLYRIGASDVGLSVGGAKVCEWTSTGMTVSGLATLNGGIAMTGQVTRANLPTVGQQISNSCGNWSTSSTSPVDVTNLSVTITTTGRPVLVMLQADGTGNMSELYAGTASWISAYLLRDGGVIARSAANNGAGVPCSSVAVLDTPAAGTHTYKAQAQVSSGTGYLQWAVLVAYEL